MQNFSMRLDSRDHARRYVDRNLFSLRIGDDLRHGFPESNDSDDLDVTDVLMGRYAGQS